MLIATKEIIEQLQKESLECLRNKNTSKREILNTLIAELKVDGKIPQEDSNDRVFAALKSYRKAKERGGNLQNYIDILESYLPKQLTKDELQEIVDSQGFFDMRTAMKWFKLSENKHLLFEPSLLKKIIEN